MPPATHAHEAKPNAPRSLQRPAGAMVPVASPGGFNAAWPQGQSRAGDRGHEDEGIAGLKPALLWMGL